MKKIEWTENRSLISQKIDWLKNRSFKNLFSIKEKEEDLNNKYLYRVIDRQFEEDILSQHTISIDQLDVESIVVSEKGLDDKSSIFQFYSDDFLVLMNTATNQKLLDEGMIDLHEVDQFGWYHSKIHAVNYKIFNESEPQKIKNIRELNPGILIRSFDLIRNKNVEIKSLNLLTGGFGLCYNVFQDEYEKFFTKFRVYEDHWRISLSDIEKNEYGIIIQLFLFNARRDSQIIDKFIEKIKNKNLILIHKYLLISFEYFYSETYEMSKFLNYLSERSSLDADLGKYSVDFDVLEEKYVRKGIPVSFDDKFVDVTKDFIDAAKTETEDLRSYFENNKLKKTTVFLLGMYHLGSRIYQQFKFDNFVHALVGLTTKYIEDIQLVDRDDDPFFKISFKNGHLTKYAIVNEYLMAIKHKLDLKEELSSILEKNKTIVRDSEKEVKFKDDSGDDSKKRSSNLSDEGDEEIDKDSEQETPHIDNNDDDSDQKRLDFPDDSNDDELNNKETK